MSEGCTTAGHKGLLRQGHVLALWVGGGNRRWELG